jgi:hypothetical protein
MGDNINVLPGAGNGTVPVATRTLTVQGTPNVEVTYGILGTELSSVFVPVDATHGLPIHVIDASIAVTAAALPLPAGAATLAAQTTQITSQAAMNSSLTTISANLITCNTGAVVVASSALPAGAATAANQATEIASLATCATALTSINTQLSAVDATDVIWLGGTAYTVHSGFVNVTSTGETTLVAGVSGKVLRLVGYMVGPSPVATNVFIDGPTDGPLTSTKYLLAGCGFARPASAFGYATTVTTGDPLRINATVAGFGVDFFWIEM